MFKCLYFFCFLEKDQVWKKAGGILGTDAWLPLGSSAAGAEDVPSHPTHGQWMAFAISFQQQRCWAWCLLLSIDSGMQHRYGTQEIRTSRHFNLNTTLLLVLVLPGDVFCISPLLSSTYGEKVCCCFFSGEETLQHRTCLQHPQRNLWAVLCVGFTWDDCDYRMRVWTFLILHL